MKKLLNTLFVTTDGAYLRKEGETVVVKVQREERLRLPIHNLGGIVCFGRVGCSPELLGLCGRRGVEVSFLSLRGRFLAQVRGHTKGNVLLRREQYRRADDLAASAELARSFVLGKIANARGSLLRALRDHPEIPAAEEIRQVIRQLEWMLVEVRAEPDLEKVRGLEGHAAHLYFQVFDYLVIGQKQDFRFEGRSRRPPRDNVNALLSFIYTLVLHDIQAALESVGLDPFVGFLHRDRPGRPGLALDLLEEFRPSIADRLVLTLINLRQVQGGGFRRREMGGVEMDDDTRKAVIVGYQKRKQEEIYHPFLEETIHLGMVYFAQALLLARALRGDLDGYPPFFWR